MPHVDDVAPLTQALESIAENGYGGAHIRYVAQQALRDQYRREANRLPQCPKQPE